MITFRQIEAFKAIMDTGMVLNAARAMHLSQPAVSRLLADLEAELGYHLFERRKGRLIAGREAKELYTRVERSFTGLRHIEDEARRIGRRAANQLRIAALPALSMGPAPRAATQFLRTHPKAQLNIQTRSRHRVIEAVADHCYDFGLTTLPIAHPELEAALVERLPFHCITHPDHPLTRLAVVTPEDLDGVNMIAVTGEAPLKLREHKEQVFRDAGVAPAIRMECSAMSVACTLVAEGVGVLLAPTLCINDQIRPHLRVIPFAPEIAVEIAILRPAGRSVSDLAAHFIDIFHAVCRREHVRSPIPVVA